MRSNFAPVSIVFVREESLGFVGNLVEYEIKGRVFPGYRGTYDDPPEPPEVQVTDITREGQVLQPGDWDFTEAEFVKIEQALIEAVDYPDPGEERDYESYDD